MCSVDQKRSRYNPEQTRVGIQKEDEEARPEVGAIITDWAFSHVYPNAAENLVCTYGGTGWLRRPGGCVKELARNEGI